MPERLLVRKIFRVTFGKEHDISGYVAAESHEQVKAKLSEIGWPMFSCIVEIPVMELDELKGQLEMRKELDSLRLRRR
jgi:hypothetical protein